MSSSCFCLLLFLMSCFIQSCFCQIQQSIVYESYLHIPDTEVSDYNESYILSMDVKDRQKAIFHTSVLAFTKSPFYDYPNVWDIRDSLIFAVSSIHTKSPASSYYAFFRVKVSSKSKGEKRRLDSLLSVELAKTIPDKKERLKELFLRKEGKSRYRNIRPVHPLIYLFRWKTGIRGKDFIKGPTIDNITFDFRAIEGDKFFFYIRDDRQLTIWMYSYPNLGEKTREGDWKEVVTYSRDSIREYSLPKRSYWYDDPKLNYHPSGKDHRYQAIRDSAFFQGHFRIVQQDQYTFCVNINKGFIYHIGDETIVRVGKVKVNNYPRWLFGKPLFIEDRDAGQLVFLSEVKRTNEKRPFPKIVSLPSKEALYERYPGLKGK